MEIYRSHYQLSQDNIAIHLLYCGAEVKKYDTKRVTCLKTDFQQMASIICFFRSSVTVRWLHYAVMVVGNCFLQEVDSPKEFTKGCPRLIISIKHNPLLGILNSNPLEAIKNNNLFASKNKLCTLRSASSTREENGSVPQALDQDIRLHIFSN